MLMYGFHYHRRGRPVLTSTLRMQHLGSCSYNGSVVHDVCTTKTIVAIAGIVTKSSGWLIALAVEFSCTKTVSAVPRTRVEYQCRMGP